MPESGSRHLAVLSAAGPAQHSEESVVHDCHEAMAASAPEAQAVEDALAPVDPSAAAVFLGPALDGLRAEFDSLLAGRDPASVTHHCGSGVSAVPNLLAMEIAGLGRTRLYPGSWSEWCNTAGTPIAQG